MTPVFATKQILLCVVPALAPSSLRWILASVMTSTLPPVHSVPVASESRRSLAVRAAPPWVVERLLSPQLLPAEMPLIVAMPPEPQVKLVTYTVSVAAAWLMK